MLERYLSLRITVLILATCLLVAIVGGATWLALSEYNKQTIIHASYQENAEKDRANASEKIAQRCRDRNFLSTRKCIKTALETYYSDQSTDQDLQAQKDMAYWAKYVFWATVGTGFVGALAVIYLAKDINVGRKIGEAQTRAYLFANIEGVAKDMDIDINEANDIRVDFDIKNFGQTPAKSVRYLSAILIRNKDEKFSENVIFEASGQIIPDSSLQPSGVIHGQAFNPIKFDKGEFRDCFSPNSNKRIFLVGRVFYEDMFDHKRETRFCYFLETVERLEDSTYQIGLSKWRECNQYNNAT
jgi:hypothetical protein